jgi:hypothetical protein
MMGAILKPTLEFFIKRGIGARGGGGEGDEE